jgi:hypothetical protein
MSRRQDAFEALFNAFKIEGKELGYMEAVKKYPKEMTLLRRVSGGGNSRVLFSRMRTLYRDRWHEIYNKNLVQEKPAEAPKPNLSPLAKLKEATRKIDE